jgi:hypothetical protein
MRKRPFAMPLTLFVLLLIAFWSGCGQEATEKAAEPVALTPAELGDYSQGLAARDMRFLWTLQQDSIDIKLSAPTTGWLAIGFNPEKPENMKGANFIIGYVKGGTAQAFDHYGTTINKHKDDTKLEGQTDFANLSGSEEGGQTVLEFTLPLDSGDPMDRPLSREKNHVLLAYGRSDSVVLKHRFRALLEVDLSTGDHSVLIMK